MRHNYDCLLAALDQVVERFLHLVLTLSIQGGGCLVKQEDLRFAYEGPRNRYTLFLTSAEFDTSLANHGFVALWELSLIMDELICVGLATGIVDLRIDLGRINAVEVNTVADVLSNRA